MNLSSTLYADLIMNHENDIEMIKVVSLEAAEMKAKCEATVQDLEIKVAECAGITEGQLKWIARSQRDIARQQKQIAFLDRRVEGCGNQMRYHSNKIDILKRKLVDGGRRMPTVSPELITAATAVTEPPAKAQSAARAKRKQRARDKSAEAENAKSLRPKKKDKQAA